MMRAGMLATVSGAALLAAIAGGRAHAEGAPVQAGGYTDFGCQAFPPGPTGCAGLTRPANSTTYSANRAVCGSPCTAIQVVAGRNPIGTSRGSGVLPKLVLAKSGATTTNATFNVFLFSSPPTLTGITDNAAYTGPFLADIIGSSAGSGSYVGSAACATTNVTTDNAVWYNCTLDSNFLLYKTTSNVLYAMIEVTAAYAPASAEQFYVITYELQD